MATKLQTDKGRGAFRKHKSTAEPRNGWIKNVRGFRRFGLHRVRRGQVNSKSIGAGL